MPSLELLESREVPTVSVLQAGTALLVTMTGTAPGYVSVQQSAVVTSDGTVPLTGPVTDVVISGSEGRDVIEVNVPASATLLGNGGNDTIFGGTGSNLIDAGNGADKVYALLGSNVINVQGQGPNSPAEADAVFTNAGAFVTKDVADTVARFFGPGLTPGSGAVALASPTADDAGTLYIAPGNAGSNTVVTQLGSKVTVNYDFGAGPQSASFTGVKVIAYFGGSGNDTYLNSTSIPEAAYGAAGNDRLVGGTGAYSILKGSGGNDSLTARAQTNDVSTNPAAGSQDIVFILAGKDNVVRAGAGDLVLTTLPYTLIPQLI